ncbi:hypothetical protein VH569_18680 [Azospirillum sp. 11R-A]|uniref:hypothetical protein n=1 Tax=Azospirillum sp. 11R-A TaxID=3111634 RepID=UPI003C1384FF
MDTSDRFKWQSPEGYYGALLPFDPAFSSGFGLTFAMRSSFSSKVSFTLVKAGFRDTGLELVDLIGHYSTSGSSGSG